MSSTMVLALGTERGSVASTKRSYVTHSAWLRRSMMDRVNA
jgi:hypothetical protein